MEHRFRAIRIIAAVSYVVMVLVNILANFLPLGGITTRQVSDSYPNLFAPAGYTFAVWGLIYLLLCAYVLYLLGLFRGEEKANVPLLSKTGAAFIITCFANSAWIFSWHYRNIPASMLLIALVLAALHFAARLISRTPTLTRREKLLVKLPFGIYFGWITVATIANAAVLLVSLEWDGFGLSDQVWTILVLAVGMLIGVAVTEKNHEVAYGLVFVWAYAGILSKHLSSAGFAGSYDAVIAAVVVCIVLLLAALAFVFFDKRQKRDGARLF